MRALVALAMVLGGCTEFEPWVGEEEAARDGLSRQAFAAAQAAKWKAGLAEWGQDGSRIERLRSSADFAIFTPGRSWPGGRRRRRPRTCSPSGRASAC